MPRVKVGDRVLVDSGIVPASTLHKVVFIQGGVGSRWASIEIAEALPGSGYTKGEIVAIPLSLLKPVKAGVPGGFRELFGMLPYNGPKLAPAFESCQRGEDDDDEPEYYDDYGNDEEY